MVTYRIFVAICVEKRRQDAGPTRVGRKKKRKGVEQSTKLPNSKFSNHKRCDINLTIFLVNIYSCPNIQVQTSPAASGASQGLPLDGGGVHQELGAPEAN